MSACQLVFLEELRSAVAFWMSLNVGFEHCCLLRKVVVHEDGKGILPWITSAVAENPDAYACACCFAETERRLDGSKQSFFFISCSYSPVRPACMQLRVDFDKPSTGTRTRWVAPGPAPRASCSSCRRAGMRTPRSCSSSCGPGRGGSATSAWSALLRRCSISHGVPFVASGRITRPPTHSQVTNVFY